MKRNILIGVCGSISAYKICEVIRVFKKDGWGVKIIMTESAAQFITPLTLSTLSMNPVYTDMFDRSSMREGHISLSQYPDIFLVAPATASIIGKVASGICDDLLTCTIFAYTGPVLFAPAMNANMWNNSIVQKNVEKLKKAGYFFEGPDEGALASGKEGVGRLTTTDKIAARVKAISESR